MANSGWKQRLREAIDASGMSDRAVAKAIDRAPSYIHGILREDKEPSMAAMVRLSEVLNVSLSWLVFDVEMSGDAEKLLRLYGNLSPEQKADFLRMAESVAGLAGKTPR